MDVRTASWVPRAPLKLTEGPIVEESIRHVGAWKLWGDRQKLKALREMAAMYGADPRMRRFVVEEVIRNQAAPRDYPSQARALLSWVQSAIYYVNEPDEQIQSPWYTLRHKFGDCDDMSVLLAAMAHSIRLPYRFVVAGHGLFGRPVRFVEGGHKPVGNYFHIYLQLGWPPFRPKTWASAEPTVKGAPLGFDVVRDGVGALTPDVQAANGRRPVPGQAIPLPAAAAPGAVAPDLVVLPSPGLGGLRGGLHGTSYAYGEDVTAPKAAPPITYPEKWYQRIPWGTLAFGVAQSVIAAVVLKALTAKK